MKNISVHLSYLGRDFKNFLEIALFQQVSLFLDRKIKQADLDPNAPSLLSESVTWFNDVLQPFISYIAPDFSCETTSLVH